MNTEITDIINKNGWVLYDADCRYCTGLAVRFHDALTRRRFELAPLQATWVRARLGLANAELLAEMRLLKPDGQLMGGVDALLEIGRYFWWTWPLRQAARIPMVMNWYRAAYRWIARHRYCGGGACKVGTVSPKRIRFVDFFPLVCFPLLALLLRPHVASWIFMWAMAFALYAGCKWLTYRSTTVGTENPGGLRKLGYLFVWPGMNATEFFNRTLRPPMPHKSEWTIAVLKMVFGTVLLWGIAPLVIPEHLLLGGWLGMVGVILVLHFGAFHLVSLIWRRAGINAEPVMQNPASAHSLTDFWGARWNTAFNALAFRYTFRPLRRWTTPTAATLMVFGLSGLVHELVISLPAHGGYGLPTLYFIAQGIGVTIERNRFGKNLGLTHGLRGWFFTLLFTAGPAFWLFHPPFVTNVILPMLTAIGAN